MGQQEKLPRDQGSCGEFAETHEVPECSDTKPECKNLQRLGRREQNRALFHISHLI